MLCLAVGVLTNLTRLVNRVREEHIEPGRYGDNVLGYRCVCMCVCVRVRVYACACARACVHSNGC